MKYWFFIPGLFFVTSGFCDNAQAIDFFDFIGKEQAAAEIEDTELREIKMLTGQLPMDVRHPDEEIPRPPGTQNMMDIDNEDTNQTVNPDTPLLDSDSIIWAEAKGDSVIAAEVIPVRKPSKPSPDLVRLTTRKPMNVRVSDIVWAVSPPTSPVAKPAPENFAETQISHRQAALMEESSYDWDDPTAVMAMQVQQETQTSLPVPAPEKSVARNQTRADVSAAPQAQFRDAKPQEPIDEAIAVEGVTSIEPATVDEIPLFTEDDLVKAQQTAILEQPSADELNIATIKACPTLSILPEARSITYFAEDGSAVITARASIDEIRGGCEAVRGGLEIDLDIVMKGRISDRGRFNGDKNSESFMTFPYFVTVISPDGTLEDKKILATAMRFPPINNHVVHAEKITQFIPLKDMSRAHEYQIGIGYQLTRRQLAFNKAQTTLKATNERVSPDVVPAQRRSYNPLRDDNSLF